MGFGALMPAATMYTSKTCASSRTQKAVRPDWSACLQISIVKRLREDIAPPRGYGSRGGGGGYDRYDRGGGYGR